MYILAITFFKRNFKVLAQIFVQSSQKIVFEITFG